MPTLHSVARAIRQAPGLKELDFFWRAAKKPYYNFVRRHGGITMSLGGQDVFIPAEFAEEGWDLYECASMHAFARWLLAHPTGVVLDVGSAVGLYSHVALSVSRTVHVIAIDADIASIAAVERFTRAVRGNRLTLLCCLIGDAAGENALRLDQCRLQTQRRLAAGEGEREVRFVCLGSPTEVPMSTLDSLLPSLDERPLLIKMDIEGAEFLALRGAEMVLSHPRATILLSVHPELMQRHFGQTPKDVISLLSAHGYDVEILSVDHEEHWWVSRPIETSLALERAS